MLSRLFVLLLATQLAPAQTAPATHPDFSGVWQLNRRTTVGYTETEWTREKLPFSPKGLERFNANKPGAGPRRVPPEVENDPMRGANPPGLMRTLQYVRPFEFVQLPNKIIQMYGWGKVWRTIPTDGRTLPEDIPAGPYWYGYSVGKWDGDTLVVNTMALDDRAWMDSWGTPISDEARVEERWKANGAGKLQLSISINDPVFYTKPWTSVTFNFTKQPSVEPEEIILAPIDEQRFYENLRKPAITPPK